MNSSETTNQHELKQFSDWILKVGDGVIGDENDGEVDIEIPDDILLKEYSDPIEAIVQSTFPALERNYANCDYIKERAILAPKLNMVDKINDYILFVILDEEKEYFSSDSICKTSPCCQSGGDFITPECLNALNCSSLPKHNLKLKIGVPIMLFQNFD